MPLNHSTTITTFRNQVNRLSADTSLAGQELTIEYDCVSLKPTGTHIIAGVVTELPAGFRVRDLLEALRIGEANFTKILEALEKMATTSSRFNQNLALDAAHDHLIDFSKILIEIHHAGEPEPADLAATTDSQTPEHIAGT